MAATRFWIFTALQAVALVVTAIPPFRPGFGVPVWHHNISLALVVVYVALHGTRFWTDRRLAARGVAAATTLAIVSGFLILYLKQDLKGTGLKDWAKWWHVAWSWLSIAFFASHTWINRQGYARSFRAMARPLVAFVLPLVIVAVLVPLTWSAWGAATFVDANYIPLTLVTWLAFVGPAYALWLAGLLARKAGNVWSWSRHAPVQAFVDRWLLPATILANVSGFPILYFATKDGSLKYVAKYWHTWPSIVMTLLVFIHTILFWRAMQRHWRHRSQSPPSTANVMSENG